MFPMLASFLAKTALLLGGALAWRVTLGERASPRTRHAVAFAAFFAVPLVALCSFADSAAFADSAIHADAAAHADEVPSVAKVSAKALWSIGDDAAAPNAAGAAIGSEQPEGTDPRRVGRSKTPRIAVQARIADALVAAWLCGAVGSLAFFTLGRVLASRATRALPPCSDGLWIAAFDEAKRSLGYRGRATLRSDRARQPYVSGLVGPVIAVPPPSTAWNRDRMRIAMLHEVAHLSRRDQAAAFVAGFVSCFAWCVPFVLPLLRFMRLDREAACDAMAVRAGSDPLGFASLILELSAFPLIRPLPSALGVVRKTDIERRITMLLRNKEGRSRPGASFAIGSAAAAIALLAGVVFVKPAFAIAPSVVADTAGMTGTGGAASPDGIRASTSVRETIVLSTFADGDEAVRDLSFDLAKLPTGSPIESEAVRLTLAFGRQDNPFTQTAFIHKEVDLMEVQGTPIVSTMDGTVRESGNDPSYGYYVVVSNGGVSILYSHLQPSIAAKGAVVKAGDRLGFLGNTGLSTGPHLGYQVRVQGDDGVLRYVDAAPLLAKGGAKIRTM